MVNKEINNMDAIDLARDLGRAIAQSPQMEAYKRSEEGIASDDKAKLLMNDYKLLQTELVRATREKKGTEIIDSLKERLVAKQEELNTYEVTLAFLTAKNNFDGLMKNINDVLTYEITGEDTCSGKSCSSCGGGCR